MGKLLIITGGSRGLGRSLVDLYSSEEWEIIELSRSGKSRYHKDLDFSKPESIDNKIKELLNNVNTISISELHIISNAATLTPIENNYKIISLEVIKNININITSSIIFINSLMKYFRELTIPKYIVNISSGAALKGYAGWSLYCASKAATENYINSLILQESSETNPFTCISFDPGVMDTKMQEEIRSSSIECFPAIERFKNLKSNRELRSPKSVGYILLELLKTSPYPGRYSVNDLDF